MSDEFLERQAEKYAIRKEKPKKAGVPAQVYHIRLDTDIIDPVNYRRHFDVFRAANEKDTIYLHINSYGGFLDTTIQYIYAMLDTKATVVSVIYTAVSAATLIAMAADIIIVKPLATFMIHNFSGAQEGKGQELRAKTAFDDVQFKAMCSLLYKGILTDKEIEEVQVDKDFWFLGSEVTKRLKDLSWTSVRGRIEDVTS